jgi:hypothetical protein
MTKSIRPAAAVLTFFIVQALWGLTLAPAQALPVSPLEVAAQG